MMFKKKKGQGFGFREMRVLIPAQAFKWSLSEPLISSTTGGT